ncbi:MAG: hypothetical protein IPG96_08130 [Proteobacteria bacterium]|nr:hypothetical protein [Pseudomonadota bacterium]
MVRARSCVCPVVPAAGRRAGERRLHDLPLAAEPTDVDLTSDGRYAVLVLRETKAVLVVDLAADLSVERASHDLDRPYLVGQTVLDPTARPPSPSPMRCGRRCWCAST